VREFPEWTFIISKFNLFVIEVELHPMFEARGTPEGNATDVKLLMMQLRSPRTVRCHTSRLRYALPRRDLCNSRMRNCVHNDITLDS
jgi:hypothetical protein